MKRIRCTYPGQIASLLGSLKETGKSLIPPEHFWLGVMPFKVLYYDSDYEITQILWPFCKDDQSL